MRTREIIRILNLICDKLLSYYEEKMFVLEKRDEDELIFRNDKVEVPFYAETTRGAYFTYQPYFHVQIKPIKSSINSIITNPILTNGIFGADTRLARYFGIHDFDKVKENNFKGVYSHFWYKIYGIQDVEWVVERHKLYMDKVGWKFIDNFKSDKSIYDFYKEMFFKWELDNPNLNILERSHNLHSDAHITMIYLGLRDRHSDIRRIIDLTYKNNLGSIIVNATRELVEYFSKR